MAGLDLEAATRLVGEAGELEATLSLDYGFSDRVAGGYLLAIALRAAASDASLPRPAALSAQFLHPGASLDFNATFHAHASTPWLYSRAECPSARDGLHGVLSQVFDEDGVLCVSSVSTLVGIPAA